MGEVYSKSSGGTSRKYIEGENGSSSNSVAIGWTTKSITVGNIGAGKQNVEVYVKRLYCRINQGDPGEMWLVGTTYNESSGNITIELKSTSVTSIYRYCEWIAFYDKGTYTAEVSYWRATLNVTVTDKGVGVAGAKVTAASADKTYGPVATDAEGKVTIKIGKAGTYTVTATNSEGEETNPQTVNVTTAGETYTVNCTYKTAPEFTYTGSYAIVNDSDGTLAENEPNWKIRLLSSGTLNFSELGTGANGIDVFLVGGGGGATWSSSSTARVGSGGALVTQSDVKIETGKDYAITIGNGGTANDDHGYAGGASSAFSYTANGGAGDSGATSGGYEFGATTGSKLYGYTVGGSGNVNGPANTGAGGRGHTDHREYWAYGGSGIVIIRNHRA